MATFAKLRGRAIERGFTMKTLAEHIGITSVSMSAKLNGRSSFTSKEIESICDVLNIKKSDIASYFFA